MKSSTWKAEEPPRSWRCVRAWATSIEHNASIIRTITSIIYCHDNIWVWALFSSGLWNLTDFDCMFFRLLEARKRSRHNRLTVSLLLIIRQGVSHLGTSMRPHVAQMVSEASVSIFSESDGEQANALPGDKGSEPPIPLLLDRLHVRAPLMSELTL